jgi:hypothetical protein
MYYPAELVLKSYKPLSLEKGMYFITKLNPGTRKEYVELWELDEIPQNMEEFVLKNGYPVRLQVLIDESPVAEQEDVGWFDAGDDVDELEDISLKQINTILADYDGQLEIDVCEMEDEQGDFSYVTTLIQGKVTLRYPTYYSDDEYITDLDVWTNGRKLGSERIVMDDVHYIEHCVEYDDRLWAIITNLEHELIWPYAEAVLHADDDSEMDEQWDDMDDDSWKED